MAKEFGNLLGQLIAEYRGTLGLSQAALAAHAFDDSGGKDRRIRELENGEVANPRTTTYMPICNFLGIRSIQIRELREIAARSMEDDAAKQLCGNIESHGTLSAVIADANAISRDVVELLCTRFGVQRAFDLNTEELINELMEKAAAFRLMLEENHSSASSTDELVRIPFRGRIAGGVPIEAIQDRTMTVKGRFVSLAELAIEAFERGETSMALEINNASKNLSY